MIRINRNAVTFREAVHYVSKSDEADRLIVTAFDQDGNPVVFARRNLHGNFGFDGNRGVKGTGPACEAQLPDGHENFKRVVIRSVPL